MKAEEPASPSSKQENATSPDAFFPEKTAIPGKEIFRAALFFFAPASVFSLMIYWLIKDPGAAADVWKVILLVILLFLGHLSMLLFLRQFLINRLIRKVSLFSLLSGVAVLPLISIPDADAIFSSVWMILLMSVVTGWGATIIPYLVLTLRDELKQYLIKDGRGESKNSAASEYPVFIKRESRYEYMYDTTYRLKNIPLIEVHHNLSLSGYLDPRRYKISGYGSGDLAECWWRIILANDGDWVEVSSRISQAEGDEPGELAPPVLQSRVAEGVERVMQIQNEAFSFQKSNEELPVIDDRISCFDKDIKRIAPLFLPLEELINPVIQGATEAVPALGIQLEMSRVPGATHVIDVVDTEDYSHYYIAVSPHENPEEVVCDIKAKTKHLVHKVWEV